MSRVLVLSADIGEGHATVAEALAGDLRETGHDVAERHRLDVLGRGLAAFLEPGFRFHLGGARRSYDLAYRLFVQSSGPGRVAERALGALAGNALLRVVEAERPDAVVSTYPVITAALGELRASGRLGVPCAATISDVCGLRFWAHRGIDLHLAMYPRSIPEISSIAGPGRARAVRPVLRRAFADAPGREAARSALGLPAGARVTLVSGGGWGVGDLVAAIEVGLATPDAVVVALTGRSEGAAAAVRAALGDEPRLRVLGFTERMPELLAAADALVHATGGVTALEAARVGCPVVVFGFPVAHVRVNAAALARDGLVRSAATPAELERELGAALAARTDPAAGDDLPEAARLVAALASAGR